MSLPRPINNTHPAAPDLFQDFVVTNAPLGVPDLDLGQDLIETLALGAFAFVHSGLEQTTKTELARHSRDGMAARALVRRVRKAGERIGQAREIHGKKVMSKSA